MILQLIAAALRRQQGYRHESAFPQAKRRALPFMLSRPGPDIGKQVVDGKLTDTGKRGRMILIKQILSKDFFIHFLTDGVSLRIVGAVPAFHT